MNDATKTISKQSYNYEFVRLKYVHDTVREEFLNIGIILYIPEMKYLDFKSINNFLRLKNTFIGVNAVLIDFYLADIKKIVKELQLKFSFEEKLTTLLSDILIQDDSSLQWSSISVGMTKRSSELTLERLFNRFVAINSSSIDEE